MNCSHHKFAHGVLATGLLFGGLVLPCPVSAQNGWYDNPSTSAPTTYSSWGSGWGDNRWFGASGTSRRWQLGIDGSNTTSGVVVNRVTPDSAAARAGINPSDVIVCVGGTQVGRVGNQIFELSEELNRHANSSGAVGLLVYDARSLNLRPMSVQLANQQAGLTGMVVIPDGRLPVDAIVTIELENRSRPHYAVRNGHYAFRPSSYSGGRIPFTLNYDPNYIFPQDTYQVRAYVTSGGRTIYDTRQPQYVLTQGNPASVQLQLTPAAYINVGGSTNVGNGGVISAGYPSYDRISQRVTVAYERYLGRRPSAMELAAWHQIPDTEFRLNRLPLELMASQEYFDLVGNNNVVWIRKVFGEIIGRTPTALELDQWMRRFADLRYSRMGVLNQMQSITQR